MHASIRAESTRVSTVVERAHGGISGCTGSPTLARPDRFVAASAPDKEAPTEDVRIAEKRAPPTSSSWWRSPSPSLCLPNQGCSTVQGEET
jgi:hypothetical protein